MAQPRWVVQGRGGKLAGNRAHSGEGIRVGAENGTGKEAGWRRTQWKED